MNRKSIKYLKNLGISILIVINGSCSSDDNSGGNTSITVKPDFNVEFTQQDRVTIEGINHFSHKLMAEVLTNDELLGLNGKNFAISPLGCAIDMAMLAQSADNESARKLCSVLGVSDTETLGAACNKLMTYLSAPENGAEFEMANAVWYAERNAPYISDGYVKSMNSTYFADVNAADLTTNAGEKIINAWVNSKSKGLIRDINGLFEPSSSAEVLILNALYFKNNDKFSFYKPNTDDAIFHAPEGDRSVKMMFNDTYCGFFEDNVKTVITLGYEDYLTNVTFIIPKEEFTLADVCLDTTEEWSAIWDGMEEYRVTLMIPKLSVMSTVKLNSIPMLAQADNLSLGEMGLPSGRVGTVGQKTYFNMNESGIELTSASRSQSRLPSWGGEITFTVDRPFLFYVSNVNTGSIIMSGRILDASNQNYNL